MAFSVTPQEINNLSQSKGLLWVPWNWELSKNGSKHYQHVSFKTLHLALKAMPIWRSIEQFITYIYVGKGMI